MRRLLIATTNPAKLAEYKLILRDLGIELELVSIADVGISESPEETGATFTENALIKARFYFERARIATLADDGGLEIDALGGEPGVRSHRWLGSGGEDSDEALVAEVIRRMKGVEAARRTARIRATIALIARGRRRNSRADGGGRNRGRDRRARVSRNSRGISVSGGAGYSRAQLLSGRTRRRGRGANQPAADRAARVAGRSRTDSRRARRGLRLPRKR